MRDLYARTVVGIGYIGEGKFRKKNNRKIYELWRSMLNRCYSAIYNTYLDCVVCKRWHCFQNFAKDVQKMPNWDSKEYQLDKDLRSIGNKIYAPKYCSFVPRIVNDFVRFYKQRECDLPRGVYPWGTKYEAHLQYNRKIISLGVFDNVRDARKAYISGKIKYAKKLIQKYKNQLHEDVVHNLVKIARM